MGDSIEYCETCHSNVWCHLNRGCQRLESLRPSDATACFARRVTWNNLQEIANWCSAADLYDTRDLLLISSPNGEQMARVGDTITKHPDGTFSVQNDQCGAVEPKR
jgi:hypothetical protein